MKTTAHKNEKEIRLKSAEIAAATMPRSVSEGALLTRAKIISEWILSAKFPCLPQEPIQK
jgi:hypothetical protein